MWIRHLKEDARRKPGVIASDWLLQASKTRSACGAFLVFARGDSAAFSPDCVSHERALCATVFTLLATWAILVNAPGAAPMP